MYHVSVISTEIIKVYKVNKTLSQDAAKMLQGLIILVHNQSSVHHISWL